MRRHEMGTALRRRTDHDARNGIFRASRHKIMRWGCYGRVFLRRTWIVFSIVACTTPSASASSTV
jgi:hypothetical protein